MKALSKHKMTWIGMAYFGFLGIFNLAMTWLNSSVGHLDLVLLLISCLPLIINRGWFRAAYGSIGILVALCLAFACFGFNSNPRVTQTSPMDFFMGYLLALTMLVASALLVYSGRFTSATSDAIRLSQ